MKKKSPKKILFVLIAVIALSVISLKTYRAIKGFEYAGVVEVTEHDLPSRVNSVVAELNVREGDKVEAGQLLMTLACEDIKLQSEQAQRDYARAQKLLHSGSMSQEAHDRLLTMRDDAALRLSWCSIKSPVKGTVLSIYKEVGEAAVPGGRLLKVADLTRPYVYFYVPQRELGEIKLGATIKAQREGKGAGQDLQGIVRHIKAEAEFTPKNVQTREERDRLVHAVKVEFESPQAELWPGESLISTLK